MEAVQLKKHIPCAKCSRVIDIKYPSSVINRLRENRPTSASITLLLAVAPPAHSKLRMLYDETLAFHVLRLIVPIDPHRRNAD